MKTLKPLLLLLAVSFLLCSGMKCKKDRTEPEPQLPAETQTGANTFGCLVDGKVWLPKGSFPYSGLTTVIQYKILNISARLTVKESVIIILRDFDSIGEYPITQDNQEIGYNTIETGFYAVSGNVSITKYDKINKIISGHFHFKGRDEKTGKVADVTDGRFDTRFTN